MNASVPPNPPFAWTCPFCNTATTINSADVSTDYHQLRIKTKHGHKRLATHFIVCPNPACKEFSLVLQLSDSAWSQGTGYLTKQLEMELTVIPSSLAKQYPDYIPGVLRNDYVEACKIKDLSAKAAATLARRCLQGMIRDYWGIARDRLIDEIEALEDKVDALTWKAIDSVRQVGNIGAHMEKDVNIVVDVEPSEASLLIGLVETLMQDWYIARHDRETRLQRIVDLGTQKTEARKRPATGAR